MTDIGAMRRLALIDPRVDKQCLYMLSIFCEGPTDLVTVRRIAKKLGAGSLSDVDSIRYRGEVTSQAIKKIYDRTFF